MAKLSKKDREQLEADLATLKRAVSQCEREIAEDDAADKAAKAASDGETVRSIAERDGTAAGIQAARLMGRRGGPQS